MAGDLQKIERVYSPVADFRQGDRQESRTRFTRVAGQTSENAVLLYRKTPGRSQSAPNPCSELHRHGFDGLMIASSTSSPSARIRVPSDTPCAAPIPNMYISNRRPAGQTPTGMEMTTTRPGPHAEADQAHQAATMPMASATRFSTKSSHRNG